MAEAPDRGKQNQHDEQDDTDREARRIEAAIEGAEELKAYTGGDEDPQRRIQSLGGGRYAVGGYAGSGTGAGLTSTGPGEQDPSPAAETGGPRGSGTGVSRTSGGIDPTTGRPVDPDQRIKDETSIRATKPLPKPDAEP